MRKTNLETLPETTTLKDAMDVYFREKGFSLKDDGKFRFIKVKFYRLPVFIPHTKGRRKALVYHDMHHLLTGYKTNWAGEFQISAWEIGSGCKRYAFAWIINMVGILGGIFTSPWLTIRAFYRGLLCRNLYGKTLTPVLWATPIGELRKQLNLTMQY